MTTPISLPSLFATQPLDLGSHAPSLASASWEIELHPGGGFVSTDGYIALRQGDGVEIALDLSSRERMRFTSRVRWVRFGEDAGPPGAWLDFCDLDLTERIEFHSWLRAKRGERDSVRLPVELRHKFRVRSAGTALSVWLGSRLDPGESRWLAKAVVDKATPTRSGALALYIDVREFRPAPPDSLDSIRLWLTHLAQRLTPLGVMVGSASVGSLQFSRLTREAGIADALVGFESVEAAAATWAAICERVAELERADPARPRSTPPASRADRRRCYRVADEA